VAAGHELERQGRHETDATRSSDARSRTAHIVDPTSRSVIRAPLRGAAVEAGKWGPRSPGTPVYL
jgi:hypothetical protein